MDLVIAGPSVKPLIWDHFLMRKIEVVFRSTGTDGKSIDIAIPRSGNVYKREILPNIQTIDVFVTVTIEWRGLNFLVFDFAQQLGVTNNAAGEAVAVTPQQWTKGRQNRRPTSVRIGRHPLLVLGGSAGEFELNLSFLEITELFDAIHGDTRWFAALNLLKGTERAIKVFASLRGSPLIWYVVTPRSATAESKVRPILLYYPADYGGISYAQDKFEGITSPNHNMSVARIQSGGETLFMFLTRPLADGDYASKLPAYLNLTKRFKKAPGNDLPPLHHFRSVLAFQRIKGVVTPQYWNVPFGFESAISKGKDMLVVPQLNGGDGGIAILAGLKKLVSQLVMYVYSQDNLLIHAETPEVQNLVLTCYSESGGNVFTAADRNKKDIRAIICFEPQYMNRHLKWKDDKGFEHQENTALTLGKNAIPTLLKDGGKVVLVGRRKDGWQSKYLPDGVDPNSLALLPSEARISILDYPLPKKGYDPNKFDVWKRRYSRLLKPAEDTVIGAITAPGITPQDDASRTEEMAIDAVFAGLRNAGKSDEDMTKAFFLPDFDADTSGGYFTHNFIVSSGEDVEADGRVKGFFEKALELIG